MANKLRSACTPEEVLAYLDTYFATVDALNVAMSKYDALERDATSASDRSEYRAAALDAERQLELLKNKRRAFNEDRGAINPPTQPIVDQMNDLAQAVAALKVEDAQFKALLKLTSQVLDAFGKIQKA